MCWVGFLDKPSVVAIHIWAAYAGSVLEHAPAAAALLEHLLLFMILTHIDCIFQYRLPRMP